jgi:hypothetical protein
VLARLDRGMVTNPADTDEAMPIYAFYMTTIRVEIDLDEGAVTEVVVDEGSMEVPTLVVDRDGRAIAAETLATVRRIADTTEWPSWDYGSARFGPAAR